MLSVSGWNAIGYAAKWSRPEPCPQRSRTVWLGAAQTTPQAHGEGEPFRTGEASAAQWPWGRWSNDELFEVRERVTVLLQGLLQGRKQSDRRDGMRSTDARSNSHHKSFARASEDLRERFWRRI